MNNVNQTDKPPTKTQKTVLLAATIIVVLGVTLLGFLLRVEAAAKLPIDYDEDDYLLAGQHYASAISSGNLKEIESYSYNLEHPPLFKLIYGLVFAQFPKTAEIPELPSSAPPVSKLTQPIFIAGRLTSVVFGTLEVLAVAILNPLGGFFLAIHTFTIKYTSQLYLEAFPALTSLVSVMAYSKSKGKFNLWLVFSALFLGMTAASKYIYALCGIAILIHWLTRKVDLNFTDWLKKILPVVLTWGCLSLVFFFVFDPFLWTNPIQHLKESILFNVNYSQSSQVTSAGYPFWQPLVWLFTSVPWHPGVFVIAVDGLIALLSIFGLKRQWQINNLYVIWLLTALVFLLIWSTHWPQYILVLTAPLALIAAEGLRTLVIDPLVGFIRRLAKKRKLKQIAQKRNATFRELRKALPWLVPGIIVLGVIALFPLIFQAAMSLTDFGSQAIRDGMTGGVWREILKGFAGKVQPVVVSGRGFSPSNLVHYAGFRMIATFFSGYLTDTIVFEVVWTILAVISQLLLGLSIALLLRRRSVWLRSAWRAIFILPWAIPEFVAALTWSQIFDPKFGAISLLQSTWSKIPGYLQTAGIAGWQSNYSLAILVMLIAALWYGFPLMFLSCTAGLKAIPDEIYDAAALDGAGRWQTFRLITWPMVFPYLIPAILLRAIFAFNQFYLFQIMRPPRPMDTLASMSYSIFGSGIGGQYAISAAINVVTVLFLIILIGGFNRWSKASEGVDYA